MHPSLPTRLAAFALLGVSLIATLAQAAPGPELLPAQDLRRAPLSTLSQRNAFVPRQPRAPSAINGWIMLDRDLSYGLGLLRERAADLNINHIQLSHGWISTIDELSTDPARASDIRAMAQEAASRGIETYIWSSEIATDSSTFCFEPGSDDLNARKAAFRAGLDAVPELAGVVISFGSSDLEPWAAVSTCGSQALGDMVYRCKLLIEAYHDVVVRERGKHLIVRDFIHFPQELDWLTQAFRELDQLNFTVMSKPEPNDFMPYYPLSPAFGNVGSHPQFIEFDLAGEYLGQSRLPCDLSDFLKHRLEHARSKGGLIGAAGRIERGSNRAPGSLNEVNLEALGRLLAEHPPTPAQIREEWLARRFQLSPGSAAHQRLSAVFSRTFDVLRNIYYVKGDWVYSKGSDLPENLLENVAWLARSSAKWSTDAIPTFFDLIAPSDQVLREIFQEKHEAVTLATWCLEEVKALRGVLSAPDQELLEYRFSLLLQAAKAWDALTRATYAHRAWMNGFAYHHNRQVLAGVWDLEYLAWELENRWPYGNTWPVEPAKLRAYAANVRQSFISILGPVDMPFLEIDLVRVSVLGADRVQVSWSTPDPSRGSVEVLDGVSGQVVATLGSPGWAEQHEVTLGGLTGDTWYLLRVSAEGQDGQHNRTSQYQFRTMP